MNRVATKFKESMAVAKTLNADDLTYLDSVIVLNCGGTINMSGVQERKPAGAVKSEIEAVRDEMRQYNIRIQFVDVFDRPPDSSNMGEKEWELVSKKLEEIIERKKRIERIARANGYIRDKGGIVVTHGTDTLQITSFVISLKFAMLDLFVPIVFTGSYAPIDCGDSDGGTNLRKAIYVAKERQELFTVGDNGYRLTNLSAGVYVLIGQDIHLASRISKVYSRPNSEGKYFFSFPAPVGNIFVNKKGFQIKVDQQYLDRIRGEEPLKTKDLREINSWGIVEHLVIDYFSGPDVLEDFKKRVSYYREQVANKEIGLILQGDFTRNVHFDKFCSIIKELCMLDVITFVGSRKVYEKIEKNHAIGKNIGKIHKSLSHAKARVKLSWLLRFNLQNDEIIQLMNKNIVGDIFETNELPQWIKYETLPNMIPGTEIIMVYPNIHYKVIDDAMKRIEHSESKSKRLSLVGSGLPGENRKISLVGFGDGHIPAPNMSIAEITREFLRNEKLLPVDIVQLSKNIEGLADNLAEILESVGPRVLGEYLITNYRIVDGKLKSAILSQIAREIKAIEIQHLNDQFAQVFRKVEEESLDQLKFKKVENVLQSLEGMIKISINQEALEKRIKDYQQDGKTLLDMVVEKYPLLIARRLIKDALMKKHLLLNKIGTAIDKGIRVEIKTSVLRGKTNTDLYEIGNMLKIMGVASDEVEGWETTYLRRK